MIRKINRIAIVNNEKGIYTNRLPKECFTLSCYVMFIYPVCLQDCQAVNLRCSCHGDTAEARDKAVEVLFGVSD